MNSGAAFWLSCAAVILGTQLIGAWANDKLAERAEHQCKRCEEYCEADVPRFKVELEEPR